MGELLLIPLFVVTVLAIVPTIGYLLISLFDGFPRLKLAQILGIVAVAAWIFTPFALQAWDESAFMFFSAVFLFLIFFAIWRREFRLLMLRRDDEFPSRWDKLGWFLMLTFAAPAGIWLFRSFRKVHWTDSGSNAGQWVNGLSTSKRSESPWDHDDDELSPLKAGVE